MSLLCKYWVPLNSDKNIPGLVYNLIYKISHHAVYKCVPDNCQCCIYLIAFLGTSNCVNTQYAALSRAMHSVVMHAKFYQCVISYKSLIA